MTQLTRDLIACIDCSSKDVLHQFVALPDRTPKFRCCRCHVAAGNAPSDWHPECMQTANLPLRPDLIKRGRNAGWIQTFTGRPFWPLDPRAEDVDILDIAHALSMICRYNGHVSHFYSVAEHSVLMARYVSQHYPETEHIALRALLHDAAEAYLLDLPRPVKNAVSGYREAERRVETAIGQQLGIGIGKDVLLDEIDTRILVDETRVLMTVDSYSWHRHLGEPLGVRIEGWQPKVAEAEFLYAYDVFGVRGRNA